MVALNPAAVTWASFVRRLTTAGVSARNAPALSSACGRGGSRRSLVRSKTSQALAVNSAPSQSHPTVNEGANNPVPTTASVMESSWHHVAVRRDRPAARRRRRRRAAPSSVLSRRTQTVRCGKGISIPASSRAALSASRSARCRPHCVPGSTLTVNRMVMPSAPSASTPSSFGGSITDADPLLVGHELVGAVEDHLAGRRQVAVVGHVDVDERNRPQLRPVADPAHLAVGHVPDRAVEAAQHRGAQRDLLDHAGCLVEVDDVADAVLVLEQHEQPGDAVLDQALRTEPERDTGDSGTGDQRCEIHADLAEGQDDRDRPDDHRCGAADHQRDRVQAGLAPRVELGDADRLGDEVGRPISPSLWSWRAACVVSGATTRATALPRYRLASCDRMKATSRMSSTETNQSAVWARKRLPSVRSKTLSQIQLGFAPQAFSNSESIRATVPKASTTTRDTEAAVERT